MTEHFGRLNSGFGRHNLMRDDFRAIWPVILPTWDLNKSLARCACLSASNVQWTLSSINPASHSLSDSSWKHIGQGIRFSLKGNIILCIMFDNFSGLFDQNNELVKQTEKKIHWQGCPHNITHIVIYKGTISRGGVNGLMGMCRWIGSHFHYWVDYNGVTF